MSDNQMLFTIVDNIAIAGIPLLSKNVIENGSRVF